MSKKYLSLEEASKALAMSTKDLTSLREKGEIRGFADRGAWKFKAEDVENYARLHETDSSPDVPMLGDEETPGDLASSSGILDDFGSDIEGGSSTVLSSGDSEIEGGSSKLLAKDSMIIPKKTSDDEAILGETSDSDVKLVVDDSLSDDSDPSVGTSMKSDSDSDVQLVSEGSDSDVKLVSDDSDSDVKIVDSDSDSDVKIAESDSDSDVKIAESDSDSDVKIASDDSSDSDVKIIGAETDREIEVPGKPTPDVAKTQPDSGISLDNLADSGISLEGVDSGLALDAPDSGIALEALSDSGISIADEDSGLSLDESADQTQFEVPLLSEDDDSEFEFVADDMDESGGSDTGVITFSDEFEDEAAEGQSLEELGIDDFSSMEGDDVFDDELEVSDDLIGGDEEMDVFDATDADFVDTYESGESQAEFVAPAGVGRMMVPVETEWGVVTFIGTILATSVLVVCSLVMFDYVRSMWAWHEPMAFTSTLLTTIGEFFK